MLSEEKKICTISIEKMLFTLTFFFINQNMFDIIKENKLLNKNNTHFFPFLYILNSKIIKKNKHTHLES